MKLFVIIVSLDHGGGPSVHKTRRGALDMLNQWMEDPVDYDDSIPDEEYERLLTQHFEENMNSLWDYFEIHEAELQD